MLFLKRRNLLLLILFQASMWTATQASSQEMNWTHFGLRPLGMGNAYVAVADDYNALFYNPAGIARLKEWDGEFLNPALEVSPNTLSLLTDLLKMTSGSSSDSTKDMLELIEGQAGEIHNISIGWTPHLVFPGFGFGIGLELGGLMAFHRYPSVFLDVGPRIVAPFTFAMNFFENRLSLGYSLKVRVRGGVNHEFGIQDIEAFSSSSDDANATGTKKLDDFIEGGWGLGSDFGLLFTPIKVMEPTIGLSFTDIGGTPYTKLDVGDTAVGAPEQVLPAVNVGFSLKPIQSDTSYVMASADMHAINQPISYSKKVNLGVEWGYGSIIKVQGGLHQGYMSAGFQFDVGLLVLRLATWGQELGSVAGTTQDRRYALQLKLLI